MKALRLSLLSLLMLAMPFTGFAAGVAPACGMPASSSQVAEPPAHDMQHMHHDGMDMSAMDAGMHAQHADASASQDVGCHCGCLCADSCIAGGGVAMSLTLPGSLAPLNSTEAPALPHTVATRASITDDLLRPPTSTA